MAKILVNITFTIIYSIDYSSYKSSVRTQQYAVYILYALAGLIVPATCAVTFFTATESYIPSEKTAVVKFIKDCAHSLIKMNRYSVFNWLILFFGWMAYVSLDTTSSELYHYYGFVVDMHTNDYSILSPSAFMGIRSTLFAIMQLGYCVYMLSKKEYPWYFMSISNAVSSCISMLPMTCVLICFFGNGTDLRYQTDSLSLTLMMSLMVIFCIPAAFSAAQLLSVPFALLKHIVPSDHFGFFVGIYNVGIIFAQSLMYLLSYLFFNHVYAYDNAHLTYNDFDDNRVYTVIYACIPIVMYAVTALLSVTVRKIYKFNIDESALDNFNSSENMATEDMY